MLTSLTEKSPDSSSAKRATRKKTWLSVTINEDDGMYESAQLLRIRRPTSADLTTFKGPQAALDLIKSVLLPEIEYLIEQGDTFCAFEDDESDMDEIEDEDRNDGEIAASDSEDDVGGERDEVGDAMQE